MSNDTFLKLKDYALKLLSIRLRSIYEIQGKLISYCIKKGFNRNEVENVIAYLQKTDLLNDNRFAKWWIEQRQGFKPKGSRVIKMELLDKGVAREIVDTVFQEMETVKGKEFESALLYIGRKMNNWKNYPFDQQKKKIEGLLFRRGFRWDLIRAVIDCTLKKA